MLSAGCGRPIPEESSTRPERIISMAPNTTEILFALGLSNRVVAVNRFSTFPPAVRELPHIGGLYDPNWEEIAALRPDLVVGLETQQEIAGNLRLLQIPFVGVSHERIDEILSAILAVGKACHAEEEAENLVRLLQQEIEAADTPPDARTLHPALPAVLVCISRDEVAQRCYIAARDTLYDEIVALAGGVNACTETVQKYPEVSPEGLLALNPDIIIDIGPTAGLDAWQQYATLPAVQHRRITVITNDYASIPGPRFVKLLADFRKAIQP
jgi:iron complex transport system substrate-binding protein